MKKRFNYLLLTVIFLTTVSVFVFLISGRAGETDIESAKENIGNIQEKVVKTKSEEKIEDFEKTAEETENLEIKEEEKEEPVPEDKEATIVSVGDTLAHKSVFQAAYDYETGTYEFSPMFKYVEKYFRIADVNVANSESPLAGAERGYSGYPNFNCPEHLATDLKELGVDVLTTANNHCLDKGYNGLCSTLDFMDEAGIQHVGTSRSVEEQDAILFKDLNGIKTAFLSYTYGTNGIPIPGGKEYSVNLIDKDLILHHIEKAKLEGAECIIVSMHWGEEYQTTENSRQDELAEFLISNDVDIILGCHPHVLQPMKMLKIETENGEKEGLVIFSQGNFFSAQQGEDRNTTAIFEINIKKDGMTNEVKIQKASYIPIYVYNNGYDAECRYELLDLNEIIKSHEESGEWSERIYNFAISKRNRCYEIIGPEIDNTIE